MTMDCCWLLPDREALEFKAQRWRMEDWCSWWLPQFYDTRARRPISPDYQKENESGGRRRMRNGLSTSSALTSRTVKSIVAADTCCCSHRHHTATTMTQRQRGRSFFDWSTSDWSCCPRVITDGDFTGVCSLCPQSTDLHLKSINSICYLELFYYVCVHSPHPPLPPLICLISSRRSAPVLPFTVTN